VTTAQPKPPTLAVIAERIAAHLWQFEADPVLRETQNISGPRVRLYHQPFAKAAGGRVRIGYVSYHHDDVCIYKGQALAYLAWLDAGNVGRHWECVTVNTADGENKS
jgi:hypothetical protein